MLAGGGSSRGVGGVGPDREIAARFSFTAANSANLDSTKFVGGLAAFDLFGSITATGFAASAGRSTSGSAALTVARMSAARFSSLMATDAGWLFAFSRSRLAAAGDLVSASGMAPPQSVRQPKLRLTLNPIALFSKHRFYRPLGSNTLGIELGPFVGRTPRCGQSGERYLIGMRQTSNQYENAINPSMNSRENQFNMLSSTC